MAAPVAATTPDDPILRQRSVAPAAERPLSTDDRFAAGKVLRDRALRVEHGKWRQPEQRPDPVDILMAGDADRVPELVPIRYGRMMQSPFAFYRGSAAVMASDLAG